MYKTDYQIGDLVMLVGPQPDRPRSVLSWFPYMERQLGGPWEISCKGGTSIKLQGDPFEFWYDPAWLDPYEPEDELMDEPFSILEVLNEI